MKITNSNYYKFIILAALSLLNIQILSMSFTGIDLYKAAKRGDLETVQRVIRSGVSPDGTNDDPPLIIATFKGHPHIVKALIDAGANVNKKDNRGDTALILATMYNNLDIARSLIEAGADLDAKNIEGKTALEIAQKWAQKWDSSKEIEKIIREKKLKAKSRIGQLPFVPSLRQPIKRVNVITEELSKIDAQKIDPIIAARIPEPFNSGIRNVTARVAGKFKYGWEYKPEKFHHITFAYLDKIPNEKEIKVIKNILETYLKEINELTFRINKQAELFGENKKFIVLKLIPSDIAYLFAKSLKVALKEHNIPLKFRFDPHISLGKFNMSAGEFVKHVGEPRNRDHIIEVLRDTNRFIEEAEIAEKTFSIANIELTQDLSKNPILLFTLLSD